jgi:hypothetical protein
MFEKAIAAFGIFLLAATATTPAMSPEAPNETVVLTVVARYVSAYAHLDVEAVKAVWPSVDAKALGRAFAGLESQSFHFDECRIVPETSSAKAYCAGTAVFVPRVGNRHEHFEFREWTFELKKAGEEWTIARVDVH